MYNLELIKDSNTLTHIPQHKLINRFKVKDKNKFREVNNPIPVLKSILKDWNITMTDKYIELLELNGVSDIAHAYLPGRSIQTNTQVHLQSKIIQFDFSGFYNSCKFDYFKDALYDLDSTMDNNNEQLVRRLVIDPRTGGLTQGLPVSGALSGIVMIPFWVALKTKLPHNMVFTQYSDDLTFSFNGKEPKEFTIPRLSQIIYETLKEVNLEFKLNLKKTRKQEGHDRKVTGIRINHLNKTTPSKKDYRFLRHALYILGKTKPQAFDEKLKKWDIESRNSFIGKVSYMRSIDQTGKINKLIMNNESTCRKHDLFETWIKANKQNSNLNAFG